MNFILFKNKSPELGVLWMNNKWTNCKVSTVKCLSFSSQGVIYRMIFMLNLYYCCWCSYHTITNYFIRCGFGPVACPGLTNYGKNYMLPNPSVLRNGYGCFLSRWITIFKNIAEHIWWCYGLDMRYPLRAHVWENAQIFRDEMIGLQEL